MGMDRLRDVFNGGRKFYRQCRFASEFGGVWSYRMHANNSSVLISDDIGGP